MHVPAAYEQRCAVCGLDTLLSGRRISLEAAHVRWHNHGGPSTVDNGLCPCPLHHKLLDEGAIGLSPEHRLLVSRHLTGHAATSEVVLRFRNQRLLPQRGESPVAAEHMVFHKPARCA